MIVNFVERALEVLDSLYGFVGGVSRVDRLDLGRISLVHDVSREAELASGLGPAGGWFTFNHDMNHAASGNLFATTDVNNLLAALGGDPVKHQLWIMFIAAEAEIVAGNAITIIQTGVDLPNTQGIFNAQTPMLIRATAFSTTPIVSGDTFAPASTVLAGLLGTRMPFPCFSGSTIATSSTSTVAAGTIIARASFVIWIGAKGVRPPSWG